MKDLLDLFQTLVLLGTFLFLLIRWIYNRHEIRTSKDWPTTTGKVESATTQSIPAQYGHIDVTVCAFTYSVDGAPYSGIFSLQVYNTLAPSNILERMNGREVPIRYDPKSPSTFYIPLREIEGLLVIQKLRPSNILSIPTG